MLIIYFNVYNTEDSGVNGYVGCKYVQKGELKPEQHGCMFSLKPQRSLFFSLDKIG